ncbi:hypothetical protein R69746_08638 [Paraburkholderia aspalathi]|nr:hypothetical protein R69746_08638 [Paraburkholderia aspalathi]
MFHLRFVRKLRTETEPGAPAVGLLQLRHHTLQVRALPHEPVDELGVFIEKRLLAQDRLAPLHRDDLLVVLERPQLLRHHQRPAVLRLIGAGRRTAAATAAARARHHREGPQHLRVLFRLLDRTWGIEAAHLAVDGERFGAVLAVQLRILDLRHALKDQHQPEVVASNERVGRIDDVDLAGRCKFVQDQRALVFERRILGRQLARVQVDQLREKEIDQQRAGLQVAWLDAHIDRHTLLAHVGQIEVRAAGCRVDDRIAEDVQRRGHRRYDVREGFLRLRQESVQRVETFEAEHRQPVGHVSCIGARADDRRDVFTDRPALARSLPQHLAERARQRGRFEQIQHDPDEQVAGVVVPVFQTRIDVGRIQVFADRHHVAHPRVRCTALDVFERVVRVRAPVFRERGPQVRFVAARPPVAGRIQIVLFLDVLDHDRIGIGEKIRDHERRAFAGAGAGGRHQEILAVIFQVFTLVLADNERRIQVL